MITSDDVAIDCSNNTIVKADMIAGFNKMTESWFEEDPVKEFHASCECDCCVIGDVPIIRWCREMIFNDDWNI